MWQVLKIDSSYKLYSASSLTCRTYYLRLHLVLYALFANNISKIKIYTKYISNLANPRLSIVRSLFVSESWKNRFINRNFLAEVKTSIKEEPDGMIEVVCEAV